MESEKTFDLKTDGHAAFSRKSTHAFLKYDRVQRTVLGFF